MILYIDEAVVSQENVQIEYGKFLVQVYIAFKGYSITEL